MFQTIATTSDRNRLEAEWNAKVGLLHWTHRDPAGKRAGGWIRLGGKTYY